MAEKDAAGSPVKTDKDAPASAPTLNPFWSGVLTFGLVSVPVELHAASGRSRVSLRTLSGKGVPLRRRYISSADGRPLERDEIVRGWKTESGDYVTVTSEELESLEPTRSREIDLRRFVKREEVDPLFGETPYFLLPGHEITKPYRLLAATMEQSGRAGIATFVMRGREYAIAIHAENGILRAQTLRSPAEIRTADAVDLPAPCAVEEDTVRVFRDAIRQLTREALDTEDLRDEGSAAIRALAEKKRAAGTDVVDVPDELLANRDDEETLAPIVDIMTVLKQRLGGGAPAPAATTAAAAPARPAQPQVTQPAAAASPEAAKEGTVTSMASGRKSAPRKSAARKATGPQ